MANWIDLMPEADLPEGGQRCTEADERALVVCRIGGAIYVFDNVCPHAGLPLGDGEVTGHVITCPYHGYTYDVRNGRNIDFPHEEPPVRTYPSRIENGMIQVQVNDE